MCMCWLNFTMEGIAISTLWIIFKVFLRTACIAKISFRSISRLCKNQWISHFWPPITVEGDPASNNDQFKFYLAKQNIVIGSVAPRRPYKNVLESKYVVIRVVLLCFNSFSSDRDPQFLGVCATLISNDLYSSDTLSSFAMGKGYNKHFDSSFLVRRIPAELVTAHKKTSGKGKIDLNDKS